MQLLSQEWADVYTQVWNNDEQVRQKLKKFSSLLKYSITDNEEISPIVIEVENGICKSFGEAQYYNDIEFEIWADTKSWREVFKNASKIKNAMDLEGFDFKGPKLKALAYKGGLERSVALLINMTNIEI